jgi:flagellar M-ring protein FliF
MPNSIQVIGVQIKELWRNFGPNQKISIILAMIASLAAVAGILYWSSKPDFQLLYSGLSTKDAAEMREKLGDEKISVDVRDSGHSLYVPAKEVYKARLLLAKSGLPKESSTGFELFEQPKFGLTDFAQKVNYQRALAGELERTISAMEGVEAARVMLVLPKDKLFASEAEQKASAAVMVTTRSGALLTSAQVQSIIHLVASSVPGLTPNAVKVSDSTGRLLTRAGSTEDESFEAASDQLAIQEKLEQMLAKKAQEMLDIALGTGQSIVKVSAQLDFSKIDKRVENYDIENRTVKSESIQSESSSTPGGSPGGSAGVVSQIPVGSPSAGTVEQSMAKSKKENVKTEYVIPSEVQQMTVRGGRIAGLSISVCLAKSEKQRNIAEVENMVKNAVGFIENETRKDTIKVVEMEFPATPEIPKQPLWKSLPVGWSTIGHVAMWLFLVLVVFIISRKFMAGIAVKQEAIGVPIQNLTGAEGAFPGAAGTRRAWMDQGLEKNLTELNRIAEQNPKAIAAWITSIANQ